MHHSNITRSLNDTWTLQSARDWHVWVGFPTVMHHWNHLVEAIPSHRDADANHETMVFNGALFIMDSHTGQCPVSEYIGFQRYIWILMTMWDTIFQLFLSILCKLRTFFSVYVFCYLSRNQLWSEYQQKPKQNTWKTEPFTVLCEEFQQEFLREEFCLCASVTIVKAAYMLYCWVKSMEIVTQEYALGALGLFSESTQGLHAVTM